MVPFYPDLQPFCERQAERLMKLAGECTDPQTRQKLIAIASEYRAGSDELGGETPVRMEGAVTICGWRH